jgi:hypothetical protein
MLDTMPVDTSPATIASNLEKIAEAGEPRNVLPLLEEIMTSDHALELIAGRSYRHVNHFDKIVLVDGGREPGYRLTLHLWVPPYSDTETKDELIHSHRFSFWSTVLTGSLRSQNFKESPSGQLFRKYQYIPEKLHVSTLANFYQFVGGVRLEGSDESIRAAGESYYLYYESTHRVVLPQQAMTCTLVLRGPRQRRHSNVFNTTYPDTNATMNNTMFSTDSLKQKLLGLYDAIRVTRG